MTRSSGSIKSRLNASRGRQDSFAHKATSALITSTNSRSEKVDYEGPAGGSMTPITHPYLGTNSWIRVMPESLTTVIIGSRAEDGEPYIQAYIRDPVLDQKSEVPYIKATEDEKFYYRILEEGEIDIMSPGIAGSYYSKSGNLELRGGVVSLTLNHYDLEAQSRAPTHLRTIMGNKRQEVGDEERFGVVRRPNSLSESVVTNDTIKDVITVAPSGGGAIGAGLASVTGNLEYAKEYLRIIRDGSGFSLVDHREGNVIDDDGTIMESDITGNPLRSRTKYGTTLKTATVTEVDEEGNVTLTLPITSTKGFIGKFPSSSIDLTIGKDILASVLRNIVIKVIEKMETSTKEFLVNALTKAEITGPTFNANTTSVNLVIGADNHLIRGEDFFNLIFLPHTHNTPTGVSSPVLSALLPPKETVLSPTGMIK
jgi:hypothetical protein